MFVVSALYPNLPDCRFDEGYYLSRHRPMVEELLAPFGLQALRILSGKAALDGTDAPFRVIAEMHFATREGFETGMARYGDKILADTANYTNVQPQMQICELLIG